MSVKIEIKNGVAQPRNVNVTKGRNAGTVMQFHEQEAWAFLFDQTGTPHPYPTQIVINIDVEHGQKPYPPGFYTLAPTSFFVGDFRQLKIGRLVLVPTKG